MRKIIVSLLFGLLCTMVMLFVRPTRAYATDASFQVKVSPVTNAQMADIRNNASLTYLINESARS